MFSHRKLDMQLMHVYVFSDYNYDIKSNNFDTSQNFNKKFYTELGH